STYLSTLSLHDALPIFPFLTLFGRAPSQSSVTFIFDARRFAPRGQAGRLLCFLPKQCRPPARKTLRPAPVARCGSRRVFRAGGRSEEHTSELQSPCNIV